MSALVRVISCLIVTIPCISAVDDDGDERVIPETVVSRLPMSVPAAIDMPVIVSVQDSLVVPEQEARESDSAPDNVVPTGEVGVIDDIVG